MGIRLDQLHNEVFDKISKDIQNSSVGITDFLENKIAEIDVVFGLPETTHVERDVEVNKRNLEKSGFIEINRNFMPIRTGSQAEAGVWVSNLDTNESPFEAATIDGQKRGINVAGYNINYTRGNIGQDMDKMMTLPIAPNLPVFFPEDNDMRYFFQPRKKVIHNKIVTDLALDVTVTRRITDEYKIDIDKMLNNDGSTQYYYMDEDSIVYYLDEEGRSFFQNDPETKLVEPYGRYDVAFGNSFQFEKIFNSNAEVRYVDYKLDSTLTNDYPSLFDIVDPTTANANKHMLKTANDENVYLENMTVTRFVEEEGQLVEKEVTQPMLVKYNVIKTTLNGMETEILSKELVSEMGFNKSQVTLSDGNTYNQISDKGINMYVDAAEIYYYYPYRIVKRDDEGDVVFEQWEDTEADKWFDNAGSPTSPGGVRYIGESDTDGTETTRKPVYVEDTEYKAYINIGDDKPTYVDQDGNTIVGVQVTDNITGGSVHRDIYTMTTEAVEFYRLEELDDNLAVWLMEDGSIKTATKEISAGKEYYYHHEVGTKYYKDDSGNIYYISTAGELYQPTNDVQEIFEGTVENIDTLEVAEKMIYVASGLTYFIDSENLRSYIEDEDKVQIQLTDVNGYRVFEKTTQTGTDEDGNPIYTTTKVYVRDAETMLTIDAEGNETILPTFSYIGLDPVFETEEVEEEVLNLVIPVAFNIVQGNVELKRNTEELAKYSDYNVEATLTLDKSLEFYEGERNTNNVGWRFAPQGDTLYIRRAGKKDIVMRMEKTGEPVFSDGQGGYVDLSNNPITLTDEEIKDNNWINNNGNIVFAEPLTGNYFDWTNGQSLSEGQQLDYNDIVKDGNRYYQYTGSAVAYDVALPATQTINIPTLPHMFWEDVTVMELEYERQGTNYKVFNLEEGDVIRFTLTRRVWEQHPLTGEMEVIEKTPYIVEKVAQQEGENLFVMSGDANFNLDNDATLESFILVVENIKVYGEYEENRANDFRLMLTGLQTVALNEDAAMIYGEDYFLSDNILFLTEADMNDNMSLVRIQAPQAELKIEFNAEDDQPKVTVPFDIMKNKYDIVIPQTLAGHEYTWIMGEELPEGKSLVAGDVVFDKDNIKFYKYKGETKGPKKSLLRLSEETQKELLRQYMGISENLVAGADWFSFFNTEWVKVADELAKSDGLSVVFWTNVDGKEVLNTEDEKASDYLRMAREKLMIEATQTLNDKSFDNGEIVPTTKITQADLDGIKADLATDLDQFVLKLVRYNEDNEPTLDEDGNIVYDYKYTRKFWVEKNEDDEIITRNIYGVEDVDLDNWEDITAPEVGYYRFGKTFTILETKAKDNVVVRLDQTGAEEFTTKRVVSEGGEITFAVDFNIEEDDGSEIPFTVTYEEINWTEGVDYIQEGQELTLNMVEKAGQEVIIRRNDEFDLIDIVVMERKDLAFVEVWHEAVDETGYIFPFGNVQFAGTEVDGVPTQAFDHVFYETIDGEASVVPDGHKKYCQVYQKGNIVYNYFTPENEEERIFESVDEAEKKFIDETFVEDSTVGKGWKLEDLSDEERKKIFHNADHNLYFDGEKLVQIRYRTRVVGLNLFENYFRGTSEYMSKGLRFQGKSPVTSRIITREIGEYTTQDGDGSMAGQPITETVQSFAGDSLVISSDSKSLLYKEGKLYDDALFTVENPTDLSHNGYVYAVPVAIINRRNQGVYHPEFNDNGTGFFINGIHVSEDKEDFADDISGFTLVDENGATLETSSVGRDRKAKFKVMLEWLFNGDYKAGGSMISKTTYRPDGLLYDEINTRDIIDLRIDANDQRKRIEDLEADVERGFKEMYELQENTATRFEQTTNYINTTANLIYSHIAKTEDAIRKDMNEKDDQLTAGLEETNTNLADLSANVFTKDVTTNLLIDSLFGVINDMDTDAFNTFASNTFGNNPDGLEKPDRAYIEGMINSFVENMEGPYTKPEFMKFLVTVLKLITDKTMYSETVLDLYIKRLSVKDLSMDASTEVYTRAEQLELIYEGLILASSARVLPPSGADEVDNWEFAGTRYDGWLGTKHLDLKKDFLENGRTPAATKNVKMNSLTKTATVGAANEVVNIGNIPGPTIWGNVHNYHALYTTWIFVETPFDLEYVKMNGDDPHAIYINEEMVASNKYCCRDTAYSYSFSVPGWYRIDAMYSERSGGHYVQLGWNPTDAKFVNKIKYVTTKNMDEQVRITKLRLDNWASKMKSLVSTIKGDATGTFTKLETKLILIEGLQRIRNHILTKGTEVTEDELNAFHTGDATTTGLQVWLDNGNTTDPGTFSALGYNVYEEDKADTDIDETAFNPFRPTEPEPAGNYNKAEVIAIVEKALQLVNGIDSLNSADIQDWVDRLFIRIDMDVDRWFTKAQIDQIITAGKNYLAGLDSVTSYEISDWLNQYVMDTFTDANGNDLLATNLQTSSYVRSTGDSNNPGLKEKIAAEMTAFLGAQSAKSSN
jgi:hypothetical protein